MGGTRGKKSHKMFWMEKRAGRVHLKMWAQNENEILKRF